MLVGGDRATRSEAVPPTSAPGLGTCEGQLPALRTPWPNRPHMAGLPSTPQSAAL